MSQFYGQEEEYGCTKEETGGCECGLSDMLFIEFQYCHIRMIFR